MHEGISPEERLLKHIRKPTVSLNQDSINVKGGAQATAVLDKKVTEKIKEINLFPVLNRILIIIAVFLLAYNMYVFFKNTRGVDILISKKITKAEDLIGKSLVLPEPKPYSFYAQRIVTRDIFESPLERSKRQEQSGVLQVPEFARNLKLVGIVLDNTREAIIEDLENKNTWFVSEGDEIKGAVVESIEEGRVTLLLADEQRIELTQ